MISFGVIKTDHFLALPFTLPFTLPFRLPFTDFSSTFSALVRVGSSGWTLSLITLCGISQKKTAPSEPTVMILVWSGEILSLLMEPECP